MRTLRAIAGNPWWCVFLLMAAMAVSFIHATIHPLDDHFFYQTFIETLASGRFDLSIPGFHGTNILAVPWYLISGSHTAQIEFQIFTAILLPLGAFLAARELFRSTWHGIVFACIIAMMPFLAFSALRGWMVATYNLLFFLAIYGAARRAWWTWIPWGLSLISLPFSIALLPLFVVLAPKANKGEAWWMRYRQIGYGLLIPVLYVVLQYIQIGHINVGVHEGMDQMSVWQGPQRIFLNIAHTLQIIFSVHNFYFVDPARGGQGDLMHTTPVLIFLGVAAFLGRKTYFKDSLLPTALLLGAIIGIGLNVLLDHMDDFYMETGIFFLILAALPVLRKQPLWIPLVLATLHFQWFYFYLQHGTVFALGPSFFLVPAVVDILFLGWCALHGRAIFDMIRA